MTRYDYNGDPIPERRAVGEPHSIFMDAAHEAYSTAYDDAVAGKPRPDTSRITDVQVKAATELGWDRGSDNEKFIRNINRNDPSADFLCREYHHCKKWDFE